MSFSRLGRGVGPSEGLVAYLSVLLAFLSPPSRLTSFMATDGLRRIALCLWGFSLLPGDAGSPSVVLLDS